MIWYNYLQTLWNGIRVFTNHPFFLFNYLMQNSTLCLVDRLWCPSISLCLSLMVLIFLKNCQMFCWMSLNLCLSDIFMWFEWSCSFLSRTPLKLCTILSCSYAHIKGLIMTILVYYLLCKPLSLDYNGIY